MDAARGILTARTLNRETTVSEDQLINNLCKHGCREGDSRSKGPQSEAVDMNGRFQMQGGKNWILPKDLNANRFFWDSHWLEIWSNHFCPSMGPNGESVAMDSESIAT